MALLREGVAPEQRGGNPVAGEASVAGPPAEGVRDSAHEAKFAAIREDIEKSIPSEDKEDYDRVFVAAQRMLYSPDTKHVLIEALDNIKESDQPAEALADEVISLFHLINKQSNEKATVEAFLFAGIPVMTLFLGDGIVSHGLDASQEFLGQASEILMGRLMKEAGVPVEGEEPGTPGLPGGEPPAPPSLIAGAAPPGGAGIPPGGVGG